MYKHSLPKKAVILVIVAALAVSLLSGCSVLKGKSAADYCVYIKDNELFITDFTEDGTHQLTTQLIRGGDELVGAHNEKALLLATNLAVNTVRISDDGKYVLYPDKWSLSDYSDTFSLYCREADDLEAEPVKIDSNISTYFMNSDCTSITYSRKGSDDTYTLYEYHIKDREKLKFGTITSSISAYNGSTAYVLVDGTLYLKHAGKDAVKLDKGVEKLISKATQTGFPLTLDTVYYMKNSAVYKCSAKTEPVKLISNVYSVLDIYDSDRMYFLRKTENERTLLDYISDSTKESDSSFTPMEKPDRPSRYDYDTNEEYAIAYDEYKERYADYLSSLEEASAINARNELRDELADTPLGDIQSLYYFDGESEALITENYSYRYTTSDYAAPAAPVIAYIASDLSAYEKPDLMNCESKNELANQISSALSDSEAAYITAGKNTISLGAGINELEIDTNSNLDIDDYGIFYTDGEENLYSVNIKDSVPQEPVLYDSDVSNIFGFLSGNKVVYLKDCFDESGDLYIGKEKISSDVRSDTLTLDYTYDDRFSEIYERIEYFTDFSDNCGTYNIYSNGKAQKLCDNVYVPDIYWHWPLTQLSSDATLYFSDYDSNSYTGQLSLIKDGKTSVVADDVSYFSISHSPNLKGTTNI